MITLDGTTGITTPTTNGTGEHVTSVTGFKNRIINGNMAIDQRNAGASVTPASSAYIVDRWRAGITVASKFSVQQNAGAVTPPAGFSKYLGATSSSAYSVASGDVCTIQQYIEGLNCADLGWGTASASTVTLSFWVRSSLTGTFGGALRNDAGNRSYPFTYTISSANTWEQKTVTIAGDTSGTWLTTNGVGIQIVFSLGAGTTYSGTANAWAGANYYSVTGATSVVGTNGATFYITGVQLEKGSTATSFDYRPYGTELALCQRYYEKSFPQSVAPAQNVGTQYEVFPQVVGASTAQAIGIKFKCEKRASPTVTLFNPTAANAQVRNDAIGADWSGSAASIISTTQFRVAGTTPAATAAGNTCSINWSADSEL